MLCKKTVVQVCRPKPLFLAFWSYHRLYIEQILYSKLGKQEKNQQLKTFETKQIQVFLDLLETIVAESNIAEKQGKITDYSSIEQNNYYQANDPQESQIERLSNLLKKWQEEANQELQEILTKLVSASKESQLRQEIKKQIAEQMSLALDKYLTSVIKDNILLWDRRVDQRPLDATRTIDCQIDVLPRTHGSSLFQRGETQVLNVLTLGTQEDAQILDDMEDFEENTKRYIHHYNFPAYSVGEIGKYNGPGRREIGHGALAEKALLPVLPSEESFPYTIRLVSECLGSNGSTSMASTCASTLSLMAGGVPIKDMVAGVAMGLVLDTESLESLEQELKELIAIKEIYLKSQSTTDLQN